MSDFLEMLSPRVMPVEVALPYGGTATVDMYSLTLHEWDELGEAVADPLAPFVMHNSRGEEVRNYADPKYLQERRTVEAERRWRRLTMALLKAGNEIDGIHFDEKVRRVRENLDGSIAAALMNWQARNFMEARASVVERSKSFRSLGPAEAADDAALEAEPPSVAETEGE